MSAVRKVRMSAAGQDRAILELARQYPPMHSLREYVTNSIDAIYANAVPGGIARVTLDTRGSRVIIYDNGTGMSMEKLLSLPIRVGESEKIGLPNQRGEKALGLLAFGSVGQWMEIITRQPGADDYGSLRYEINKSGEGIDYKEGSLDDASMKSSGFGEPFNQGTRVILHVDKNKMKHFNQTAVKRELREIYLPLLMKKVMNIEFSEGDGESEELKPIEFKGEKVFLGHIPFDVTSGRETKQCLIYAGLWLDLAKKNGRIGVYSKGVRVYEDISKMFDEDIANSDFWNCGRISGFIEEPNLLLTLGRDKIDEQRSGNIYGGLIENLVTLGSKLWPDIKQRISSDRNLKGQTALQKAYGLLKAAFQELEPFGIKPSRQGSRQKESEQNKIKIKWGIKEPQKVTNKKKKKWQFGIPEISDFDMAEENLRSKTVYRGHRPVASLNSGHRDWKRIVEGSPESIEAVQYVVRQLAFQEAFTESNIARTIGEVVYSGSDEQVADIERRADDLFFKVMEKIE
ncbi:ATP-binding protein [Candidatus Pacearchaeota archaeon]|nr:ATP-binding protein [Candidatus Pacearchaeota archaeon]